MKSGLVQRFAGKVSQAGVPDAHVIVEFRWDSTNPAEIVIDVQGQEWCVARSAFVVASEEFYRGAWAGMGAFSVCHRGELMRMAFKPLWEPRSTWAFVTVLAEPVRSFVAHSLQMVPISRESDATLALVEAAIPELLR